MRSRMESDDAGRARATGGGGAEAQDFTDAGTVEKTGAARGYTDESASAGRSRLADRWAELSDEDLAVAGGTREGLIRVLSRRLEVSKGEAKRQVLDAMRVVRGVEEGVVTRGKRMRRTFERTGRELGKAVIRGAEGVAGLVRVLSAGGLAGKGHKRLPYPEPEKLPVRSPGTTRAAPAESASEQAESS